MGKYKFYSKVHHDTQLDYLHSIRNELAEANRLKRLELKIQDYTERFKDHDELYLTFIKDLKDQA